MSKIIDLSEVLLELGLETTCSEKERAIAQTALTEATGAILRHLGYDPVQGNHTEYYPQVDLRRGAREVVWEVSDTQAFERELSEFVSNQLQLKHLPVRSITSLKIDYDARSGTRSGSFAASSAKVEGTDFWPNYDGKDSSGQKICRDGILMSQGVWPDLAGSVQVIYVAGYSDAELHGQDTGDNAIDASPIADACKDEAVRRVIKKYSRMKNRFAGFVGPLSSESLGDYSYTQNSEQMNRLLGGAELMSETVQKLSQFMRYDLGVM